jgi:Transposase DDE domain group 1/Glycosyl transferase family 2
MPEVYEFLEAERIKYAIRLPANQILQGRIGYLLKRPIGRPPNEVRRFHANFSYQAATWTKPRRVIAKVEWHPGELYPRVGFIVTNMSRPAERVVAFYNKRGTCEQYLRRTLDSVASQSVPPALWVVVDDGSTDETPAILEEYARRLPYLRIVRRTDRGRRQVGPGVIEAFYAGLQTVRLEEFDYLCKVDMDLDLPVNYFEVLMQRMESNPRLGTTSGKPWFVHPQSGALPRYDDLEFRRFLRSYQHACLRLGKRAATARTPRSG